MKFNLVCVEYGTEPYEETYNKKETHQPSGGSLIDLYIDHYEQRLLAKKLSCVRFVYYQLDTENDSVIVVGKWQKSCVKNPPRMLNVRPSNEQEIV